VESGKLRLERRIGLNRGGDSETGKGAARGRHTKKSRSGGSAEKWGKGDRRVVKLGNRGRAK